MIVVEQPGGKHHTIRPSDITLQPTGAVIPGGFGKYSIEKVAGHLIQFFQEKGAWVPFYLDELKDFFLVHGWEASSPLFGLTGHWVDDGDDIVKRCRESEVFVCFLQEGVCAVTDSFIRRCAGLAHH